MFAAETASVLTTSVSSRIAARIATCGGSGAYGLSAGVGVVGPQSAGYVGVGSKRNGTAAAGVNGRSGALQY